MWNGLWGFILIGWNVGTFFLYGWDKLAAKKHWRRMPESFLLLAALLMGGVGAMFGMVVCNHKTSKIKFRVMVPLFVFLNATIFWLCI